MSLRDNSPCAAKSDESLKGLRPPNPPGVFRQAEGRGPKAPALGCRKSGLRHFSEVFIAPLRLRRGQGAMQGNPCYARLFADLPYMPPNPIIASGGKAERRQWREERGGSPVSKGAPGRPHGPTQRDLCELHCGPRTPKGFSTGWGGGRRPPPLVWPAAGRPYAAAPPAPLRIPSGGCVKRPSKTQRRASAKCLPALPYTPANAPVFPSYFLFGFLFMFSSRIKSSNKDVSVGVNISHFPS